MGRCRLAAVGEKGSCVRPLGAAWRYFGRILCLLERKKRSREENIRRRRRETFEGKRAGERTRVSRLVTKRRKDLQRGAYSVTGEQASCRVEVFAAVF